MLTSDLVPRVNADVVLLAQGADPQRIRERRPALHALAEQAVREGMGLIQPAALIRNFMVQGFHHENLLLETGHQLSGPLVAQHLAGAGEVVAAIATIGPALEKRVDEVLPVNPALALALDAFGSAAAEALGQEICERVRRRAAKTGLQTSVSLSPGLIGWPVDAGQPQIFDLLLPDPAWVCLTAACMMQPRKSISLIIGIGEKMDDSLTPCDFCSGKETCRHRYHEHLKAN